MLRQVHRPASVRAEVNEAGRRIALLPFSTFDAAVERSCNCHFVFASRFSWARRIPITVCRSVPDSDLYRVVVALPAIFLEPKKGESNRISLLLGQRNIHELDANRCSL
jgi:hypothetical protein